MENVVTLPELYKRLRDGTLSIYEEDVACYGLLFGPNSTSAPSAFGCEVYYDGIQLFEQNVPDFVAACRATFGHKLSAADKTFLDSLEVLQMLGG